MPGFLSRLRPVASKVAQATEDVAHKAAEATEKLAAQAAVAAKEGGKRLAKEAEHGKQWVEQKVKDSKFREETVDLDRVEWVVSREVPVWMDEGLNLFLIDLRGEHIQWLPVEGGVLIETSKGAKQDVLRALQFEPTEQGHELLVANWDAAGATIARLTTEAFHIPSAKAHITGYAD